MADDLWHQTSGAVMTITINRPERRNALNASVAAGLSAALDKGEADPSVRAIVLTGAEDKAFCAGGDLQLDADGTPFTIEAADPRAAALAIALSLRQAAETEQTAALITPDRMLTRRVTAALDRWNIVPDDSAGLPLQLSPPGRFLRHVAQLFVHTLTGERLMTLLKHPLCHSGADRGAHLLHTRDLELHLRRYGPPFPTAANLTAYAGIAQSPPPGDWIAWLCTTFCGQQTAEMLPLAGWTANLRRLAEAIAGGVHGGSGTLWERNAGQKSLAMLDQLDAEAPHGGVMSGTDFANLIGSLLSEEDLRDRDAPHEGILVWGTLEARVQGAGLLILGGLNEGSWPEPIRPDPWLNRTMRYDAGLTLPERRIGLSAHDFQQAVAAQEVWLTRALRSDDAETVASRWLNRLTNLLSGLDEGKSALSEMRERGRVWLDWATASEAAVAAAPAPRPSPRPPVSARPRKLSVTEIKRLIRDPYAIYARHVLRLTPLDPLNREPDGLLRGTVIHDFLEAFIRASVDDPRLLNEETFLDHAAKAIETSVPWPTARRLWLARLNRIAAEFVAAELIRRETAMPENFEASAALRLDPLDFLVTGRADRIDRGNDGALRIYDYKTGKPPGPKEQPNFDKQLLIEAAIAERGGFVGLDPAPVHSAVFLGLAGRYSEVPAPLESEPPERVLSELRDLIEKYLRPIQGYTSRRLLQKDSDTGDFDHLARFGEWDRSTDATPEDLT